MRNLKIRCLTIIALFIISTSVALTVNAQETQYTNYIIKEDGSVEPDNGAITHVGNNYVLTQNITGSVTIQRDHAIFNGDGYAVTGNAVAGTYNLDDNVLYLEAGFNLTKAWNATVQNVIVENCVNGISLVNAYYCKILNNTLTENAVDGIKIAWSANNTIVWNTISSNGDDAIQVFNSGHNNIMLNNMFPGDMYRVNGNGIQLNGNCSYNKIKGNNVTDFDTGIYIKIALNDNASYNIISYNNFRNNQWNATAIEGENNTVTSNNFYANGLISQGANDCTGNYWGDGTVPSIYDVWPLSAPVDTNIEPEFILLSQPAPTQTPIPTKTITSSSALSSSSHTTTYPTPTPAADDPTATPSTSPTPTSKSTIDLNQTQSADSWPTIAAIIIVVLFVVVLSAIFVIKRRKV